ncbi:hypothetical protein ABVT39_028107 [Epinephelus coioides]
MSDSGDYTCVFPFVQRREKSHVMLVVVSSPKPSVTVLKATDDEMQLQCEVHGASPKPKVEWKDSDGNILPAEEPQVTDRGGSYDIILQTTVTKNDYYRCVVTQEEINHQIHAEIYVQVCGNSRTCMVTCLVAAATLACIGLVAVWLFCLYPSDRIGRARQPQTSGHLMKNNVRRKAGCGTRTQTKPEDLQSCSGSEDCETTETED